MKSVYALAAMFLLAVPANAHHAHSVLHASSSHQNRKMRAAEIAKRKNAILLENMRAEQEGYIQYDDLSLYLYGWQRLVPLPENQFVVVDAHIEPQYRFCTPDARNFVLALGNDVNAHLGRQIKINSAIRTKERQIRLRQKEHNPNAITATGSGASLHERGNTLDIAYLPYTASERKYIEGWLNRLVHLKAIEYQKETGSKKMYHVIVYRFPVAITG